MIENNDSVPQVPNEVTLPQPTFATQRLSARILELVQVQHSLGQRRLHGFPCRELPNVKHRRSTGLNEANL